MLKQIALSVALLMGVCAFAQAPEAPAATESADKFSGIQSTVQLVKLRRQLLAENKAAFEDKSNDTDVELQGAYLHITNGFMTTDDTPGAVKAEYEDYNYYVNPKTGLRQLKFPDLAGKQIDLPQVSGVIHSHQVGDWQLTASRIASMWIRLVSWVSRRRKSLKPWAAWKHCPIPIRRRHCPSASASW